MEEIRNILYPLGFIANLLFGLRFLLQWWSSEKKQVSYFSESFWMLSFIGSLLMTLHGFIQLQYPIYSIQICNAVLYWRNWHLISSSSYKNDHSIKQLLAQLFLLLFTATGLFCLMSYSSLGEFIWMKVPFSLNQNSISPAWEIVGFFGTFLFASRFWIHWWRAEQNYNTALNEQFWLISLTGSFFALAYFIKILDPVNILGYSLGLIPYFRNFLLTKRA